MYARQGSPQGQPIVLPKTTMRHTRASALRYQQKVNNQPQRRSQQFSKSAPVNATILPLHEFGHIANLATKDRHTNFEQRRRDALRERSKARYKHWGNTIEALREKKVQDRVKRMAEIERRQQIVDDQEAAYQEQQRRVILDRANSLLYAQNGRVAAFHSGLQYATTLAEREVQIRMKEKQKQVEEEYEREWHEREVEQMKEFDRREEEKNAAIRAASLQKKEDQLRQLQQYKERARRERQLEIEEGEIVRENARNAAAAMRAQEVQRKQKQMQMAQGYLKTNEEQKLRRAAGLAKDRELDAKLIAYAQEKERIDEQRKAAERRKAEAKAKQKEALMKRQFDQLEELKKLEEVKLLRDAADLENRTMQNLAREAERQAAEMAALHNSRQAQIRARKIKADQEKQEGAIYLAAAERRRAEMQALEDENERLTAAKNRQHQAFLKRQQHEKGHRLLAERMEDLHYHQSRMEHDHVEEQIFNQYMGKHLEAVASAGLSTKPMELIAARDKARQIAIH